MKKHLPATHFIISSIVLFFYCLMATNKVSGQVATYYNWSQSTTTYTPGYPVGVTEPANIFPEVWDDMAYNGYKLPFNFTFNGTLYSAANGYIGLDTDGWICFSNGMPVMTGQTGGGSWINASDHTGVYLYGTANNNGFAGFNADLHYQTFATFTGTRTNGSNTITNVSSFINIQIGTRLSGTGITNGTIVIAFNAGAKTITMSSNATANSSVAITPYACMYAFTRGTAPNRQFVIQWNQVRRYNYPEIVTDNFNFQMILNEGGGIANLQTLQVVYGNVTTSETTDLEFQVGLRGASAADFNARKSTTNWSATTAATLNTDHVRFNNSIRPANGLTFTWSPCTAPPGAAGVITGASPVCPGSTQTYSIAAVAGASTYNWTYSGSNTTYSATTNTPTNTFIFAANATGGTITVTAVNFCGSGTSSSKVITVTAVSLADISYPQSVYCVNSAPVSVVRTGPAGGTYSALPSGLSLNPSTGTITPASSVEGVYLITYSYNSSGCALVDSFSLAIKSGPTVSSSATPSTLCLGGGNSQLQAEGYADYQVVSIPYTFLTPTSSATVVWSAAVDNYVGDAISAAIPLPFTFNFFGQNITQVYAASDGYMQLGASNPDAYIPQTLPNTTTPNNIISLAWSDWEIYSTVQPAGYIRWFVNGTSPNRVFVLEYYKLLNWSNDAGELTGQIRLYENGSSIEVAVTKADDGGANKSKTLGIENSTGTLGLTPTGRNNVLWNVNNEAWRFFKGGPFTYAWSPATYLNSTTIANPLASSVNASITYTVRVTDQNTGCYTDNTVPITLTAPLSGTYTVGTGGNFTTLTSAIDTYNTVCIGGPIIFELINNSYTTASGETFPLTIKSNAYASAINTLTIRPAAGKTVSISGNNNTGIFIFRGADYVTIDGANIAGGLTRNLTISNTNNSAATATVVYMEAPNSSDGATNNTVKNSIISGSGSTTTWCAVFSGGSDPLNIPPTGNNDNTFFNNKIIKAATGFAIVGPSGNEWRNVIDSNDIGSITAAEKLGFSGVELYQQENAQVKRNKILNLSWADYSSDVYGIYIVGTGKDCVINENKIDSIVHTSVYGAHGIFIGNSNTDANLLVANNMISKVVTSGYNGFNRSDNGFGISVVQGGGYKIYFNSVSLTSNPSLNGGHRAACLYVDNTVTASGAIDFRNNILANFQTVGNSNSRYAMMVRAANSVFSNFNYNVFYAASTNLLCRGSNATTYTTLANVQANTAANANSINVQPVFLSANNLHLNTISNTAISNTGEAITVVQTDIDAQTRNGLTPDPGADEYVEPNYGSWVGRVSTVWTDPQNWEANFVPTSSTDVYIKGGYTFMPTVTTVQAMRDLNISAPVPSNTPTLTLSGGTIQVYRNITKTGGIVMGVNGTLEMMGTATQNIPSGMFWNDNLLNLIISNTHTATGVTLGGTLDVYRSVTFTANGKRFNTNNRLTLKSTATETAWVGDLTGKTFLGNTIVERYIGTGAPAPLHNKSWQLLAVPVITAQTLKAAWQEGAASPNANLRPGKGTQLTSALPSALSLGFDVYTPAGPSIKTYDPINNNWVGVPNTNATPVYNQKGYMVFVRGDRSVITYNAPAVPTVMRAYGKLFTTGADAPPVTAVSAGRMESVGNPYASAIDFRQLSLTNVSDIYYLWDPRLTSNGTSAYGLGGYQTFTKDGFGDYRVTPGGGSFGAGGSVNNIIQSGSAFFVQSNQPLSGSNGTVNFSETAKIPGSTLVHRETWQVNNELRINLNVMHDGEPVLIDGVLFQFGQGYNNSADGYDARKLQNSGENLAIRVDTTMLSVERRGIVTVTDTLFLNLGNMRNQNYRFELLGTDWFQEAEAWLVDTYSGTQTPLLANGGVVVDFSVVNNPNALKPGRFYIIFRPSAGPLPVRSIQLSGTPYRDDTNKLNWWVEGERDMESYQVQRSADGQTFETIYTGMPQNAPGGSAAYQYIDDQPIKGNNYYRIKGISEFGGRIQFSNVVLLTQRSIRGSIVLYPNPSPGKSVLKYENLSKGWYLLKIYNSIGALYNIQKVQLEKSGELMIAYNLPKGSYRISLYDNHSTMVWQGWWIVQ